MNRLCSVLLAIASAALAAVPAGAQDWPSRPVRIVNTFAPGGAADILARIVADHLSSAFKQQFFVETRAGAGGVIGVQTVRGARRLQFRHHHALAHHHRALHQSQDRL
jgi:tripartite-type tricarboxylate transporter receptor subunit TctC